MNAVLDPKGPKYVAYYGGVGSGKSMILCITMLIQGIVHGGEYVIARQFMPELKRTTYKTFLEICPKELIIDHKIALSEIHIRSASGKPAIFYFVGLDEPDKLRSLNLSGFGIDEASQVSEEAFLLLMNRLRHPQGLRKGILVGNPAGHDWVYHRFVKQDMLKDEATKRQYLLLRAPSTENVHLPDGYVQSMLQNYSEERIQREVMGSFDAFEGMVYPEFRRDLHVIQPFVIPDNWTRVIGIDHGYRNPSAWVWGAVDNDGNIYVYREFYQKEWLIEEICKGHREKNEPGVMQLMKGEKISDARIDPSTRAQRNERNGRKVSDFDLYQENLPSDFPLFLANNEVTPGIDRVKTFLKPEARTGRPRLFIFSTCSNLIEEMTKYRYRELSATQIGRQNEKEEPYKHDDHAVDALRYLIMGQPEPNPIPEDPYIKLKYNSLEGQLFRDIQALKNPIKSGDPFEQ
jgi:phage terminase large subunit